MACRIGLRRAPSVGCQAVGVGILGQPCGEHGSPQPVRCLPGMRKMRADGWIQRGRLSHGQHADTLLFVGGWVATRAPCCPCAKRRGDSGRGGPPSTESYIGAGWCVQVTRID